MSQERPDADALAAVSPYESDDRVHSGRARVLLQQVDDEVHRALDALGGDSTETLRSLIVPAHVPIIIGSILKVRHESVFFALVFMNDFVMQASARDPSSDHWANLSTLASRAFAARFDLDVAAAKCCGQVSDADAWNTAAVRSFHPAIQTFSCLRAMCSANQPVLEPLLAGGTDEDGGSSLVSERYSHVALLR
jgi:hypothetical protein